MDCLNLTELGLLPLYRHPKRRKGSYKHKDQIECYKNVQRGDESCSGGEDTEEISATSEHFRKIITIEDNPNRSLFLLSNSVYTGNLVHSDPKDAMLLVGIQNSLKR